MRIAVVSDIHGNLPALEAVVADFARRGVDAVVNLGDSLSGPLLPRQTAQYLMAQGWTHLAGNHERQILDTAVAPGPSDAYARSELGAAELAWLRTLAPRGQLGQDVLLCHGTPHSDLQYLLETVEAGGVRVATPEEIDARLGGETAALVVCGHSHMPRSVRSARGQLLVNPGSVGLPGFRAEEPLPHCMQNASPDARYAIVEHRAGHWHAALLTVPYDHLAMARLAQQRGRPQWQRALATGYV